jgi:hypothetical protein
MANDIATLTIKVDFDCGDFPHEAFRNIVAVEVARQIAELNRGAQRRVK